MSFGLNSSKNVLNMANLMLGKGSMQVKTGMDASKIENELIQNSSLDEFSNDDIDKEIDALKAGMSKECESLVVDGLSEYVPNILPPSHPVYQQARPPSSATGSSPAYAGSAGSSSRRHESSGYRPELTDEELRHKHIQTVLNMRKEQDIPDFSQPSQQVHAQPEDDAKSTASSIDYEAYSRFRNDDDEKVRLYNQIIALQESLKHFYVGSAHVQFNVSRESSLRELRDVFMILVQINNQVKNHQMFEAVAMGGAKVLENIFNGQREILGTKINLKGWSNTLSVKLRHLQYETSEFIKQSTSSSQISPGARIAMELVSSLVLYSIYPKKESSDPDRPEEELQNEYNNAMRDLDNVKI